MTEENTNEAQSESSQESVEASKGGSTEVKLPQMCEISDAKQIYDLIKEANAKGSEVIIDASEVTSLTTPCLQILISASSHVTEGGGSFVIKGETDVFRKSVSDFGLFSKLQEWGCQV